MLTLKLLMSLHTDGSSFPLYTELWIGTLEMICSILYIQMDSSDFFFFLADRKHVESLHGDTFDNQFVVFPFISKCLSSPETKSIY